MSLEDSSWPVVYPATNRWHTCLVDFQVRKYSVNEYSHEPHRRYISTYDDGRGITLVHGLSLQRPRLVRDKMSSTGTRYPTATGVTTTYADGGRLWPLASDMLDT